MKQVERPAPVLVAPLDDHLHSFPNAAVRVDLCTPQVVDPAKHVIMPERRKREAQPALVNHLASSKRAEHAALEQILFSSLSGSGDGCPLVPRSFICKQSFEY